MMPWLLAFTLESALAADMTWTCGVVSEPADARPWARLGGQSLGAEAAGGRAMGEILARVDDDCVADCIAPDGDCPLRTCISAAGDVVRWEAVPDADQERQWFRLTVRVEPAPGADDVGWEWAEMTQETYNYSPAGLSWAHAVTRTVSWGGSLFADWPDDGTIIAGSESRHDGGREFWDDGACAWGNGYRVGGSLYVEMNGTRVDVLDGMNARSCNGLWDYELGGRLALMDGDPFGFVEGSWAPLAGEDADGDHWTVEAGDCDDADPHVYCWADEVPGDGVDQDCNGADTPAEDSGPSGDSAAPSDSAAPGDTPDSGSDPAGPEADGGAGCAASPGAPSAWCGGLLASAALWRRRRRRGDGTPRRE